MKAQEKERLFPNVTQELALLSINFSDSDTKGDNTAIITELASVYVMSGNSKFNVEGLERNQHGFVLHSGTGLSYISSSTGNSSAEFTSIGIHIGAGYG